MSSALTREEIQYLTEHFRLLQPSHGSKAIPVEHLLDPSFLLTFMKSSMEHLGTDKLNVAASQFTKRFGFVMTVPMLYSMSVWNKSLNTSLSNCFLVPQVAQGTWMPHLSMEDLTVEKPNPFNRQEWRQTLLKETFTGISLILERVSTVFSLPKAMLWENIAIYIYWLYEKKLPELITDDHLRNRVNDDFNHLIHQASGDVFGETVNPLNKFYKELSSTETVRTRKTCCLYYELNSERQCCKTCPKVQCDITTLAK